MTPAQAPSTKQVRCPADLAEKLVVIAWHDDLAVAECLGQIIRPEIDRRFAELPEAFQRRALDRIAQE